MRVTFTCEKCGAVLYESNTIDGFTLREYKVDGNLIPPCPNCAKLTYGPLTEEMVAEALREATHRLPIGFESEARFVLRLLNEVVRGLQVGNKHGFPVGGYLRNWLLELARKP